METLIAAVAGLITGSGAAKIHPRVDAGYVMNAGAGLLGGLLGRVVGSTYLAPMLGDEPLAAAALSGALGGVVVAVLAGAAWRTWGPHNAQA